MSDNLPFEILIEIMKKLPVKPLLQFRSVSKAWKCMIDSSHFVAHYQGQVQHLLVDQHHFCLSERDAQVFISFIDDDDNTLPQQKVPPFVPESINMLEWVSVIGCSRGLLCLEGSGFYPDDCDDDLHHRRYVAILWNISLRKAVNVVVPLVGKEYHVLGFGICPATNDPKIVNITHTSNRGKDRESTGYIRWQSYMPWQVDIFTLSTGAWRTVSNNLPRMSIELFGSQVVIDGFIHWLALDMESGNKSYNMIISFDITREEFKEVNLPDSLAHDRSYKNLYISKLRKSLVMLERDDGVENNPSFIVWMMDDGIAKSFTKLYTIYLPDANIKSVKEFRKNGEAILELSEYRDDNFHFDSSLVVYEPYAQCIENLGIDETDKEFSVSSYMETLHLHDQPNSIVYNNGKRFILRPSGLVEL